MTKVLVLYYSSYGHIEAMARAAAEGVREAGAEVDVKRVPEIVPEEVALKSGFKLDQPAPVATVDELANYDAIILGIPTRFGVMAAQMKNFWDQTGALWMKGALVGKVGSVFASTATQHGGQETTIISAQTMLLHQGFVIVGLPYAFQGQMSHGRDRRRVALWSDDHHRCGRLTPAERDRSSTRRAGRVATSPRSPPSSQPEDRAG